MNKPPNLSGPDVGQLKEKSLPEAPFLGGRNQPFRVYLAPDVHAGIWQHAIENGSIEICGVVVGRWAHDASGPHAQGTAYIRGEAASSKFAEVTFTHETWARINEQMDKKYADLSVIGWYHSHPDFGIFLSDRDMFIQEHFFAGPGQFAYVVDPIRKTEGVFVWNKGKATLAPYHWVGDRVQVSTPASEPPKGHGERDATQKSPTEQAQPSPAASSAVLWIDALLRPVTYLCLFFVGFLLAANMLHTGYDFERQQIRQDARTNALIYLNYRPGLGEDLDDVSRNLASGMLGLDAVFKQHPELVDKSSDSRERLSDVVKNLNTALGLVRSARDKYSLSPQENARLQRLLNGDMAPEGKTEKNGAAAKPEAAGREPEKKADGLPK